MFLILFNISDSSVDAIDLIRLDSESGEIAVAGRIDHEQVHWINVSVRASDNGIPVRSSFADVILRVIDENDNNPYFTEDTPTAISIPENTPIGTCNFLVFYRVIIHAKHLYVGI